MIHYVFGYSGKKNQMNIHDIHAKCKVKTDKYYT
jgi:hypothetical protein